MRAVTDASEFPDVATLSYEEARDELRRVVVQLEAGGEPLEVSLALWERGEALAGRCQEWLDGARKRLEAAQAQTASATADDASSASELTDDQDEN